MLKLVTEKIRKIIKNHVSLKSKIIEIHWRTNGFCEIVEGDEAKTMTVTFGQLQELAEIGFCNQFRWDATTGRERIRDVGTVRDHAKQNPVEHKGKDYWSRVHGVVSI